MALDFRAEQIQILRTDIQVHRERIKSRHNVADPYSLPYKNRHRRKFEKRMSFLAEQVEKYSELKKITTKRQR